MFLSFADICAFLIKTSKGVALTPVGIFIRPIYITLPVAIMKIAIVANISIFIYLSGQSVYTHIFRVW